MKNLKSSKLLKTFEIGKNQLSSVIGGTEVLYDSPYTIAGSDGCSLSCPDNRMDHKDGSGVK